jgi:hypothetical protein
MDGGKKSAKVLRVPNVRELNGQDIRNKFKASEPTMVRVEMTPQLGARLLEYARPNRDLKESGVTVIERDMLSGAFDEENPNPIGFDRKGRMADGQHRTTALVRANKTYFFWAALGLSEKTISKMDGGKHRTLGDRFRAFTTNPYVREVCGDSPSRTNQASAITKVLYDAFAREKNPSIEDACKIVKYYRVEMAWVLDEAGSHRLLRRAVVLSALTLAKAWAIQEGKVHEEKLDQIMEGLRSGEMLHKGPVKTLRDYLIGITTKRTKKHLSRGALDSQWVIFTKTLRAIQAALTDEALTKLQVPSKSSEIFEWFLGMSQNDMMLNLKLKPLRAVAT